jgi:hypothetical protein
MLLLLNGFEREFVEGMNYKGSALGKRHVQFSTGPKVTSKQHFAKVLLRHRKTNKGAARAAMALALQMQNKILCLVPVYNKSRNKDGIFSTLSLTE